MKFKMLNSKIVNGGLLAAVLVLTGVAASAGTIAGSKHDFSAVTGTNGQICIACHAPHNTAAGLTALWNHQLSAVTTYVMYNSTFSSTNTGTVDAQPGATSKLCLSCHDGTVAVNSFGGVTGTVAIAAASNFGTNLTNDHPISIVYNTALVTADGALFEPSTKAANIGTGGTKTRAGTIATNLLFNTKVDVPPATMYTTLSPFPWLPRALVPSATSSSRSAWSVVHCALLAMTNNP